MVMQTRICHSRIFNKGDFSELKISQFILTISPVMSFTTTVSDWNENG